MKQLIKSLLFVSSLPVLGLSSVYAHAANFPSFQVQEGSVPGQSTNLFSADKITGNYSELITFNPTNQTFNSSIEWNAGQYVTNNGNTVVTGTHLGTGAGDYGLYGLFQGSGTYSVSGSTTNFVLNPGGTMSLWVDPNNNTSFTAPASGAQSWTLGNTADDYKIANGAVIAGGGQLDPTQSTCMSGIDCGSFGLTSSVALTAAGSGYLVSPSSFYPSSFQSGQLNTVSTSGTQQINGSMDLVFAVPEPAEATLLLTGLAVMGFLVRRKMPTSGALPA